MLCSSWSCSALKLRGGVSQLAWPESTHACVLKLTVMMPRQVCNMPRWNGMQEKVKAYEDQQKVAAQSAAVQWSQQAQPQGTLASHPQARSSPSQPAPRPAMPAQQAAANLSPMQKASYTLHRESRLRRQINEHSTFPEIAFKFQCIARQSISF